MASRLKVDNLETIDGTFNINVRDIGSGGEEKGGTAWDSTIDYSKGDIVTIADGTIYVAVLANTNSEPTLSNSNWSTFMDAGTY